MATSPWKGYQPRRMARSGQDVIGFTRIFVLFCTLVLVPALFLSGFGVIAILNERQAERQRRVDAANVVLRQAETAFGEILDATDRAVLRALDASDPRAALAQLTTEGKPIGAWVLLSADGVPLTGQNPFVDDEPLLQHLTKIAARAEPQRPAHASVDEAGYSGVVSMQRVADGRAILYGIDDRLAAAAVGARFPGDPSARVRMADGGTEPVQNAVERLMQIVNERSEPETTKSDAPDELAFSRLAPPFDRFTIVVESRQGRTHITMIAYIVLLVVFLATLITGVVITARLIWQETRLSRLKTDFVSHMSHELRTPLTSIRMFIDTLKLGRADPEEEQECLDLLAKETERLSEMIERVLGYARLRAGRRLFTARDVPVHQLVDETIAAFRAQRLDAVDLVLTTDVPRDLVVHVDRDALVEALLNLVSNAFKYTGPHKEISVFAKHGRRGRVIIGVKDNGPGLPKAEHKRVFERFYQANSLLSSKQPGSGLGLAITKAIAEGNAGRIHVESEPGRGATFFVELRAAVAQVEHHDVTAVTPGANA
jgi:signal transduction histidine kinase